MNRIAIIFVVIFTIIGIGVKAQSRINYSVKAEVGHLKFQNHTIDIDTGPNWKGYYLSGKNGFDINIVNGINYKKIFAGIGVGYLNFEGINGLSIFSDIEYLPLKTKLTPLINLKIGYSHIWNQYENGTGTAMGEFGLGLNYRLSGKVSMFLKSGLLMTQQSFLIPIKLGFRF